MKVALKNKVSQWLELECEEVVIPMGIESEVLAISVIDDREVVVIRRGILYDDGGEAVYSELLAESDG